MNGTVIAILCGTPHDFSAPEFDAAVAERFSAIRDSLTQRTGNLCYDGNRTKPTSLGWRLRQHFGISPVEDVLAGKIDSQIEEMWHYAADVEYWYRYEKDWGVE